MRLHREDVLAWHRRLAGVSEAFDLGEIHDQLDAATLVLSGPEGIRALAAAQGQDYITDDPEGFEFRVIMLEFGDVALFSELLTPCTVVHLERQSDIGFNQIVLVSQAIGEMRVRSANKRGVLRAGRAATIVRNVPAAFDHLSISEFTGLMLPSELFEGLAPEPAEPLPDNAMTRSVTEFMSRILYNWITVGVPPTVLNKDAEALLIEAARMAMLQLRHGRTEPEDRGRFVRDAVEALIERRHWQAELTVTTIASELHLSRRQLSRYFTGEGGVSNLLTNRRLDAALQLLDRHPSLEIQQAAHMAGFTDARALRYALKQANGSRPTEYRDRSKLS